MASTRAESHGEPSNAREGTPTPPRAGGAAGRKYGNRKTVVDGLTFDSLAEARRYGELKLLERAGAIRDLRVHPRFVIHVEGTVVCTYIADFVYVAAGDTLGTVEDVKSPATRTAVYRLKRKLLRATWGIEIREVEA